MEKLKTWYKCRESRVVIISARVSRIKEEAIKQRCLATGESVSDIINEGLETLNLGDS